MKKGEITVFFSLLLLAITILIGTALESARDATARERAALMTAVGLQSIWAAYDRPLYERYHLLAYDLSLGQAFSEERLRQAWLEEANAVAQTKQGDLSPLQAVSVEFTAADLLGDYDEAEFRAQAIAYIKRGFGVQDLEAWIKEMPTKEEIELKEKSVDEAKKELTGLWEELDGRQSETRDEALPQSWWEEMRTGSATIELLKLLPQGFQLHQGRIDSTDLYENRQVNAWEGLQAPPQEGMVEKLALHEYYLRHFPSALSEQAQLPAERLAYQLEYLLYGHETDVQNLSAAAAAIHRLRLIANFVYLQTDMEKQSQTELPAVAVATLIGQPKAKDAFKQAFLFYWAYREAQWDTKSLLAGHKAALWKTAKTWRTPLFGALPPEAADESAAIRLGYREYLHLLLLWHHDKTDKRALSLIEYELRSEAGYESVCLDRYMVSGQLTYRWQAEQLFSFALPFSSPQWTIQRIYSY